jgi:monoamine oxidase
VPLVRDLPERVDVVVVGAGLAGLSSAAMLRAGGASVAVVEARDRVGGRTWSRSIGDGRFDLGGQWLGPGQDRVAALARRLGVATFPTFAAGDKVLDDGARVARHGGTIPSLGPLELAELHLALRRIDRLTAQVSARDPASTRHAARLDALTVADHARRIHSARVRGLLGVAIGAVFGVDPAEMSLLWFLAYLRAGGGLMKLCEIDGGAQERRFIGGAQTLADRWADELGVVATRAPVRRIRQTGGGGPVGEVVVTTDRGAIAARRAIVAVPPPLAARIDMDPPAPARRDQLLQRHAMGAIVKLIVTYERAFWRDRGMSGEAVALAGGPVAVTFDNCSHDLRQPALVAFVQGAAARRWDGDVAAVLAQLARWFGDEARRPTAVTTCDWAAEPWSRGCPVAVAATGALTSTGTTLRQPDGRVHFAGTETATAWTGYLEGALESGERAAREVLRAL